VRQAGRGGALGVGALEPEAAACYLPDDEVFALREHLRARADLVRMRTMLKNRLHAVLHRRGVLAPAKMDLFTKQGRQWSRS